MKQQKQQQNKEKEKEIYTHITKSERLEIAILINKEYSLRDIAKTLNRSSSSISTEVRNNSTHRIYDPHKAHAKARKKRSCSKAHGKKINANQELERYIVDKLKQDWNPDEISGRMKLDNELFYASKTAIYDWLYSMYGQRYCCYLASHRFRPKRRRKKKTKRAMIPNRVGIEHRSRVINQRLEYGHYEGDTIVSGKKSRSKSALTVVSERKARYVSIRKIENLKPDTFNSSINNILDKQKIKSLTLDNGLENRYWEQLSIQYIYFCATYSSYQKGGVENINRMIRRYIPKGSDISKYSHKFIKKIEDILNNKPRKCLGYKTPLEVMEENNLLIKKIPMRLAGDWLQG
jgi:IS30 family transposase